MGLWRKARIPMLVPSFRLEAFIYTAGFCIILPFPLRGGTPLHLRAATITSMFQRPHRRRTMAGNIQP